MAMIKCNECGKEMSDLAEKCPSCGCPNRPKKVCPECNESMDSSATVCQKCGYVFKTTVSGNGSVNPAAKSKIAAGILGIFLGAFGVHNFYLGYNGKAVGQLLITLLSCFILFRYNMLAFLLMISFIIYVVICLWKKKIIKIDKRILYLIILLVVLFTILRNIFPFFAPTVV